MFQMLLSKLSIRDCARNVHLEVLSKHYFDNNVLRLALNKLAVRSDLLL